MSMSVGRKRGVRMFAGVWVASLVAASSGLASSALASSVHSGEGPGEGSVAEVVVVGQPAAEAEVVQVYDLRDLAMLVRQTRPEDEVITQRQTMSPFEAAAQQNSAEELLARSIANAAGLTINSYVNGFIVTTGTRPEHGTFLSAIEAIRGSGERYALVIEVHSIGRDEAISLSGEFKPDDVSAELLRRVQQSISAGRPTRVFSREDREYVSEYTPVVSTNSVAYGQLIGSAGDGLSAEVLLSSDGDQGVRIRMVGQMFTSSIEQASLDWSGYSSELGLVESQRRSIESDIIIPLNRSVVIGVCDGFGESESIDDSLVIVAKVSRIR